MPRQKHEPREPRTAAKVPTEDRLETAHMLAAVKHIVNAAGGIDQAKELLDLYAKLIDLK